MKEKKTTSSTQSVDVRKILLGMIGERIVASYLRKRGHEVEESLNVFDTEKDMLVDGNKVEVKTQVPIVIEDSFGITPSQKAKIMGSHRVYFLSVPLQRTEDDLEGTIFEMDPRDPSLKAHKWLTHKGREMICFPRRQAAMKQVHRITDERILKQLKMLSTSYL
jgi:hypothetical protein